MLYKDIVFGPIHSRRLGISLGINLLPIEKKICSFNCIYCECGLNTSGKNLPFNSKEQVEEALIERLTQMKNEGMLPDTLTFAGNGEPTLHPDFLPIVEKVIEIRDRFAPQCKISVLSNATQIGKENVFRALQKVDNNILKLDAVEQLLFEQINQPNAGIKVKDIIEHLFRFNGDFTLQTMFLRGEVNGKIIDNTLPSHVDKWIEIVKQIRPKKIMLYSLDRPAPYDSLQKVSPNELREIAQKLVGFDVSVAE
ncbi:MAG TPA: radical SAM protein [Porphyromonadaceae bacterium]|nr:radical SAM protein [Porphyromonadaceae bacterium]